MNNYQNTPWHNSKNLAEDMLESSQFKFPPITKSNHYPMFLEIFNLIKNEITTVCDLGCGSGDLGNYLNKKYHGFDLQNIIDNVAKLKNPHLDFSYFDAYLSDFKFLNDFDLVICNSFLSELKNFYDILFQIMNNSKKYIIIHRQSSSQNQEDPVIYKEYVTYANEKSTDSQISINFFNNFVLKNNYKVIKTVTVQGDKISILLEKII